MLEMALYKFCQIFLLLIYEQQFIKPNMYTVITATTQTMIKINNISCLRVPFLVSSYFLNVVPQNRTVQFTLTQSAVHSSAE